MERWLGAAPSADAPGAGRSGARRRAPRKGKKVARTNELKGVRASTLKGCCARLFQGPQDFSKKIVFENRQSLCTGGQEQRVFRGPTISSGNMFSMKSLRAEKCWSAMLMDEFNARG